MISQFGQEPVNARFFAFCHAVCCVTPPFPGVPGAADTAAPGNGAGSGAAAAGWLTGCLAVLAGVQLVAGRAGRHIHGRVLHRLAGRGSLRWGDALASVTRRLGVRALGPGLGVTATPQAQSL